ncbi:TonB-dependent receptor [Bacteroides sp. 224]|uniref:TonB-dependent receptor n=1 Tax=Bacteroides sp. 224 TaxID=2302936 RepID=UPI0013D21491|nr:TonB-dependent receptor [Bacteroides sp. 224]
MRFKLTMIAACVSLMAQAQTQPDTTLNRTVVVEQEYNPNIMDARKVNVVPKVDELTVTPRKVEYDAVINPSTSIPGGIMDAYTGKEKQEKDKPGYVRLGYGTKGSLDVRANYLFNLSAIDKLNLSFAMDGINEEVDLPFNKKWDRHYYKTKAGIDYLHKFSCLDMNVTGNFGLSNFKLKQVDVVNRKKFTSGDIGIDIASTDKELPLQFKAGMKYLNYSRANKFPSYYYADEADSDFQYYDIPMPSQDNITENMLHTYADVWASIDEFQSVGIYGRLENKFYNFDEYKNGSSLALKPYYQYTNGNWNLKAGINIDLGFGFGKKIQIAPDVKVNYIFADKYILYAQATGGRIRNDFRNLESFNPYGMLIESYPFYNDDIRFFHANQLEDGFEQINANIGFKASPFNGFWLNIYGGFQKIKSDLGYGQDFIITEMYTPSMIYDNSSYIFMSNIDTRNFYAGAQFNYDYKDWLSVSLGGKFYSWKEGKKTWHSYIGIEDVQWWKYTRNEILLIKPTHELNFQLNIRPIPALDIAIGYEYMKREETGEKSIIEEQGTAGHGNPPGWCWYPGYKPSSINNLTLGATYRLFKDISVYARVSNLLDKEYDYYLSYPSPGINFLGGLSFKF